MGSPMTAASRSTSRAWRANFRLREGKGDDASAFFSLDRMSFREIHTNPETGAWFSFSGHFTSNELTARRVDGSLFEFRSIKAGQVAVIEDAAGNLVARDRGVIPPTILFDTGGDDEPGGTFVDLLDLDLNGPHAAFGNLCAIATVAAHGSPAGELAAVSACAPPAAGWRATPGRGCARASTSAHGSPRA
jgi:hypothetical protein